MAQTKPLIKKDKTMNIELYLTKLLKNIEENFYREEKLNSLLEWRMMSYEAIKDGWLQGKSKKWLDYWSYRIEHPMSRRI